MTRELTQEEFARKLGNVTRGAVGNWERDEGIKTDNLVLISKTFGVDLAWLSGTTEKASHNNVISTIAPTNATVGDNVSLTFDKIPLYGHAVGGEDGEFVLNGTTLDHILAPPSISADKGAYAVTIVGDSMAPRYEDGETVFVDPTRRVVRGNYVIAQIQLSEDGPLLAYVKRFVRHNSAELVLEQFNPAKELRFEHDKVVSVHYIVMGGHVT
jgi:phage repressor protein C with HTH and peptisase S24 domain